MKSFVLFGLAAAALAFPQSSSSSCNPDVAGTFQITTVNLTKRDVGRRQASALALTLTGGILKDSQGRIGYIAANNQFQFDNPIQAGSLVSSGWALCSNGSLSLGGSTVFFQCLSGNFYNLYNKNIRPQDCLTINLQAVTGTGPSQPTVSQVTDGQPQATKPGVVSQITDGQPQATKPGVVTQISDGQPQATKPGVVTQISDGQPQATKPGVVSQIPDGQPQASKPAAASKPPVVTQISDGQPQATKPAPASQPVVTQISDGQPQATKPGLVSQISDSQPQATKPSVPQFTAAAVAGAVPAGAFAAGIFGLIALL